MRFADLDAVTIDGFGTLVELEEPVKPLVDALETHGVRRSAVEVAEAFAQEAAYYRPRSHFARDAAGLERLRRECVTVFLDALKAPLDPEAFVDAFMDALVFRPIDGAVEALGVLRARRAEAGGRLQLGLLATRAAGDAGSARFLRRSGHVR